MSLPPLANLLAVRLDATPGLEEDLRDRFPIVVRPASGWLLGVRPLPGAEPDVRDPDLVFAEGGPAGDRARIARLADTSPHRLAEAPGDFTFLRFRRDGSLLAVRSAGGLVPLYVSAAGDVVATQLGEAIPHLRRTPSFDPLSVGLWVSGWPAFPNGRSLLAGVRVVGRGAFVESRNPGRLRAGSYFDPRPERLQRPTEARRREHAERFRRILLDRVETDLDGAGANLLTLSGGIDSGSLAGVAAALGTPFSTISLLPPRPETRQRELGFIRRATAGATVRQQISLTFDAATMVRLYRDERPTDPAFYVPHPVLQHVLDVRGDLDSTVVFGGEFGDEVGGSHFNLPDWVFATPLSRLLANPRGLPYGPPDIARWLKWRAQNALGHPRQWIPERPMPWLAPAIREEYRQWRTEQVRSIASDRRPLRSLAQRASADGWLPMNWEALSRVGMRRSVPFFNRTMLELAFECHPDELVAPGFRRLTRAALDGLVDQRVLQRSDKGLWGLEDPLPSVRGADLFPRGISPAVAALVDPHWLEVHGGDPTSQAISGPDAARLWLLARFQRAVDASTRVPRQSG